MSARPKNPLNIQQDQIGTPSTTYLISQGGSYYPLYNHQGYQAQAVARPCCNGAFEPAEQTAKFDDTDLYSLKPNVNVDFDETFQESKGSESFSVIFKYNRAIYTWTQRCFYSFLVGLLGPLLAIAWGLVFAILNFVMVWGVNPSLKVVFQLTRIAEVLIRGVVRAVVDPVFQSFGQVFTFLRGNFTLSLQGLEGLAAKKESGIPAIAAQIPAYHESQA